MDTINAGQGQFSEIKIGNPIVKLNPPKKKRHWLRNLLLLLILGGLLFFGWWKFDDKIKRIIELEQKNLQVANENGQLRTFVFGACQINAFSKDYFFVEGQDCSHFFPELTSDSEIQASMETNVIDFINVFYAGKQDEDLVREIKLLQDYSESKTATVDKNAANFWEEFNAVLNNEDVKKYLTDYKINFEKTEKELYTLEQDGKALAEVKYLPKVNRVEVEFLKDEKKLRLDNFSSIKSRAEYTLAEFSDFDFEKAFADIDQSKVDLEGLEHYLILGKNEKNVDTIILATVNHTKKQITMVSVPRDLWVNARKINSYYYFFGMSGFIKQLESLLGVKIKNYILIDMYAFPEVVDKVGGIDYYFDYPLIDPSYKTLDDGVEGTLYFPQGQAHLSGIQALRVSRTRHTSSDFARADRQQQVLKALKDKIQSSSAKDMASLVPILMKKVDTNFSVADIMTLAATVKDYEVRAGNVISTGNILTSEYFEYSETSRAYILKPKDDDWGLIKQFVINAIYRN
jgi:LCP family protein required for cell wall assembly